MPSYRKATIHFSSRRRGIGQALLQQAIRDFYQRGLRTVALSVRLNNEYGALRLYERAGMQIGSQIDRYSKPVDGSPPVDHAYVAVEMLALACSTGKDAGLQARAYEKNHILVAMAS